MRWRHLLILIVVMPPLAMLPLSGALADSPSDDDVRRIGSQLECPVCAGESVANSEAELAKQMRAFIKEKLAEGWTDDQILQYHVDRYGESILLNPPKRGFAALVWLGAVAAVALGVLVVGSTLLDVLRREADEPARPMGSAGTVDDEHARYTARLEHILQGDDHG